MPSQRCQSSITMAEAMAQAIKEQAISTKVRAMEEYKRFKDFKEEVANGCSNAYKLEFTEYKNKVT